MTAWPHRSWSEVSQRTDVVREKSLPDGRGSWRTVNALKPIVVVGWWNPDARALVDNVSAVARNPLRPIVITVPRPVSTSRGPASRAVSRRRWGRGHVNRRWRRWGSFFFIRFFSLGSILLSSHFQRLICLVGPFATAVPVFLVIPVAISVTVSVSVLGLPASLAAVYIPFSLTTPVPFSIPIHPTVAISVRSVTRSASTLAVLISTAASPPSLLVLWTVTSLFSISLTGR
jgi:hypothetical protein